MTHDSTTAVSLPIPHPVSGIIDCRGDLTFGELVSAIEREGWSADGMQPEPEDLTVAELLERRQPRPSHWGSGLLADRCCRLSAGGEGVPGYASIRAPRKASGPDLAFLFIGAEGALGAIERASMSLVKPAPVYLEAKGSLESVDELFAAAKALSLLDPLSTRRLDWTDKALSAWVPVRAQSYETHRRHVRDLGLSVTLSPSVPREARFLSAVTSQPRLHLSGSYATLAAFLARADEERGRKRLDIDVRYLDSHGAQAILSTSKTGFALLESLYAAILEGGRYDDVFLVDPDGETRSAAVRLALRRTKGEP